MEDVESMRTLYSMLAHANPVGANNGYIMRKQFKAMVYNAHHGVHIMGALRPYMVHIQNYQKMLPQKCDGEGGDAKYGFM